MNIHDTLPKQTSIEEFLGREFFPKYPFSLPLKEAVEMVQLEFNVSDEARALTIPRGHGTDGTVLECLTHFAMLRLQEKGYIVRTGKDAFKATSKKYTEHVSRQDVAAALVSFKILRRDQPAETALNMLGDKWPKEVLEAVKEKFISQVQFDKL